METPQVVGMWCLNSKGSVVWLSDELVSEFKPCQLHTNHHIRAVR